MNAIILPFLLLTSIIMTPRFADANDAKTVGEVSDKRYKVVITNSTDICITSILTKVWMMLKKLWIKLWMVSTLVIVMVNLWHVMRPKAAFALGVTQDARDNLMIQTTTKVAMIVSDRSGFASSSWLPSSLKFWNRNSLFMDVK